MDQYATNIDDLPLVYDEQPEFQDENVNIKIQKEEEKGFFSNLYSTYLSEESFLLILLLIIRTFPINNLFNYIPLVNSIIPENGFFATIVTSIILALSYLTIVKFIK